MGEAEMKLLTKEVLARFKKVGQQEGNPNPIVCIKFFDPCGSWTWYATSYTPEDRCFFGYVVGFEKEWGYFSLDEMSSVKNRMGLGIERDLHFTAGHFNDVIPEEHRR
jgi:hypothetical protein